MAIITTILHSIPVAPAPVQTAPTAPPVLRGELVVAAAAAVVVVGVDTDVVSEVGVVAVVGVVLGKMVATEWLVVDVKFPASDVATGATEVLLVLAPAAVEARAVEAAAAEI